MEAGRLSVGEFAFPGPLRDQLVAAILDGTKTTTTGLVEDYERDGEPLPRPGDREVVIDSAGDPVTLIEIVAVRVVRVGDVDLAHAIGEGEGYGCVADWRAGHEAFWHSAEMRAYLGDPVVHGERRHAGGGHRSSAWSPAGGPGPPPRCCARPAPRAVSRAAAR